MADAHDALAPAAAAYCPNCDGARRDWLLLGSDQNIRIADVVAAVALETGVPAREITGGQRHGPLLRARFMSAWLARRLTGHSLPVIGRAMGGRDHTSILSALRRMEGMLAHDESLRDLEARCARRAFALSRKTGGEHHE